jgi:Adenylosuccinate synthetase
VNGHVIVVDLGYGDAGKGTIVDWLCARSAQSPRGAEGAPGRPVQAVVRFNGGAQAAHHVLARGGERAAGLRGGQPGGEPHAFAQFGSGTFTPGTRTFLSRFMLVDPLALVAEAEHLERLGVPDPFGLVAVDRDALLTTPYHRAANQAREQARGDGRHGSCGMGIGETASYALAYPEDAPRVGDIASPGTLLRKLGKLRDRLPVSNAQGPPRDLEYQESLTAMLLRARPVYDQPGRDPAAGPATGPATGTAQTAEETWADAVAGILRAPVVIRSHGPAVTDKTWRPAQVLTIGLRLCPIRFSTPPRRPRPAMAVTATLPLLTDGLTWTWRSRRRWAAPATAPTPSSFSPPATPPAFTARCAWSRAASTPRSATPR